MSDEPSNLRHFRARSIRAGLLDGERMNDTRWMQHNCELRTHDAYGVEAQWAEWERLAIEDER